jgi:protein-tyrosine phosphatase
LDGDAQPFAILTVCTGNVCRSPAVERLLRQRLGPTVAVTSAGTSALVGDPIAAPMAQLLATCGADTEGFHARLVSAELIEAADLVLPATRAHRSLVVDLWPAVVRRTFTVREFARLLGQVDDSILPAGTPSERLREAIPLAAAQRGRTRVPPTEDDIVDPYGRDREVYKAAFGEILPAVATIVRVATGSHSTG